MQEDFDGNGQSCGTCHRTDRGNVLAFGPEFAQWLFVHRPHDELFTPINSRDATGTDFSLLLERGTVPIPIRIPRNVTVVGLSPGAVVHTDSQGPFVYLHRKTPTIQNIALKSALMLDGREGRDFLHQAADAVATHDGPHARVPTLAERQKLADFQQKQFSDPAMKKLFKKGKRRALPHGRNASEELGRAMLLDNSPSGKCGQCHGGPNLDRTSEFNAVNALLGIPAGQTLTTNFSSIFDDLPLYQFTFQLAIDPLTGQPGTREIVSSDPGALLNQDANGDANPCIDISACIVNPGGSAPVFVIPSLWDIGDREGHMAFMHGGQFRTFEEALDGLYIPFFEITADGLAQITGQNFDSLRITQAERDGVVAYMRHCLRSDSLCEGHGHRAYNDEDDDELSRSLTPDSETRPLPGLFIFQLAYLSQ